MVYRRSERETFFVLYANGQMRDMPAVSLAPGLRLVPFSASNNLLTHDVVVFASAPAEYETTDVLVAEVRAFIHRFCDVSEGFEEIAASTSCSPGSTMRSTRCRTFALGATSVRESQGSSLPSAHYATRRFSRVAPRQSLRSSASSMHVEERSSWTKATSASRMNEPR